MRDDIAGVRQIVGEQLAHVRGGGVTQWHYVEHHAIIRGECLAVHRRWDRSAAGILGGHDAPQAVALHRRRAVIGIKDSFEPFWRYLDEFPSQFDAGNMAQPEKSGVRNAVYLTLQRVVQLLLAVAVNVAPKRRDTIDILSSLNVVQITPFSAVNDARILPHPLLHLCEGVPKVGVIKAFKFFVVHSHRFSFEL